ncbi:NAD(P)/FAD-dependent oxidoreductase [Ideonella sp. BN130291]|uniref:NAD(P)/FAD-dependent oxidoreductase n=1 Tax=Ideonella sp. BN130291 TaxID=3112940 RepID=UPI002E266B56|nr:FAD-binding oxidoreductase [Ideonella sp. BN130291]
MRVCVIGGAAVGSAVALFLMRLGGCDLQVQVVERDPTYARASSALSASSIRQQFSNAINVQMSQFGLEWVRRFDVGFVESGYLFLATVPGAQVLRENHAVQRALHAPVALLTPDELRERLPWINTEGVALASLGLEGEGWFDGYAFTQALKREAQALGAVYVRGEVAGLSRDADRINAAQLADGERIEADVFVNAAGPWARQVAAMAGITLPVFARRRTVFKLSCPTALPRTPLVIDTSGVWFRSEGDGFLAGWSPGEHDADPDDLPLDADLNLFEERLWPALAERVPAFEALRMQSAWAGYYEVHPLDHNAILGRHPELTNLFFANGFSGHGLQHAPAAGRGVAELILEGGYRSLDLAAFRFERVLSAQPFVERSVI